MFMKLIKQYTCIVYDISIIVNLKEIILNNYVEDDFEKLKRLHILKKFKILFEMI